MAGDVALDGTPGLCLCTPATFTVLSFVPCRRLLHHSRAGELGARHEDDVVVIHPSFRVFALANR